MNKFFYPLTLLILCISCTSESIDTEKTDENLNENPETADTDCTGETEISGNYNHKLFDADFLNSNIILEGNDDDFSRKFIYNNGVFICTGTFDETNFDENGNAALYAVDETFEPIWTFPEQPGEFYDVIHTSDDNYVAVGRKGNGDVSKIYVVKVNLDGELIWEYIVEVEDEINLGAYATAIVENSNGEYIITGKTTYDSNIFSFGYKSFVLSLNTNGEHQWVKPLSNNAEPSYILINNNGNYLVTFRLSSDLVVDELSTNGELLKYNTFGSSDADGANHIHQQSDNSYLITGYTRGNDGDVSTSFGNTDIWVLKLDTDLNLIQERTYGGFGYQTGIYLTEIEDGSLILCGQGSGNFIVEASNTAPIFLRINKDLCLIDWDESLQQDEYNLTDALWLDDRKEIVTFSNANDRGNIYDTTDDFYHRLLRHKFLDE
ncbi:hypothetical protein [Aurantibacter sp.]|uniref:hypothetical protein n=1 Tax=Aurantibacter sp. TaxID=2807103 RepID=UPI003263C08C